MVPPSQHSLDVAEPCLPGSQACELEDGEPGKVMAGTEEGRARVPEGQRRVR